MLANAFLNFSDRFTHHDTNIYNPGPFLYLYTEVFRKPYQIIQYNHMILIN
jgi:hypothetical protein